MGPFSRLLVIAIGAALTTPATFAQHEMDSRSHREPHAPSLAEPTDLPYRGEVHKVDYKKGKVTLRHGPITDLGVPAMTAEYLAADSKLVEGLHVGDKVNFKAERLHGAFVLTGIAVAR